MNNHLAHFSQEQWDFLAFLEYVGTPVSADLAGTVASLSMAPFLNLVQQGEKLGLLSIDGSDTLKLSSNLPAAVTARLERINSPERLWAWLEKLEDQDEMGKIPVSGRITMLSRAGRHNEAAKLEIELAREARSKGDFETAMELFERALHKLSDLSADPEYGALFIEAALALSDLAFYKGRHWEILPGILEKGRAAAEMLGDRRSEALVDLHLGAAFYFRGKRIEAMSAFASGSEAVKELGDEDIIKRSAWLIGLFFFMQGLFREAIGYLDGVAQVVEAGEESSLLSPFVPHFTGYSAMYLGQLHHAIGSLDCNWRMAKRRSDPGMATTIRAGLANALVYTRKWREAALHISAVKKEALETHNDFALYLIFGAEAHRHFLLGRMGEAYSMCVKMFSHGMAVGLIKQYASPWALEQLFEFERLGFDPIVGMTFQEQFERIFQEPNIHLKGVALRLKAKRDMEDSADTSGIDADLDLSEKYLLESGDPVQLAKTWLERARLRLRQGDRKTASSYAKKARLELSGPLEEFFPDDLRYLLEGKAIPDLIQKTREELVARFLDMLETLLPSSNPDEILVHAVSASNRLLGAERGGLWWFKHGDADTRPVLRAGYNLNVDDVSSEEFKPYLRLVCKAFREAKAVVLRPNIPVTKTGDHGLKSVLCIPFNVGGRPRGVLYHDNSYLNDCFDFLDSSLMLRLAKHLTTYVERILQYSAHMLEVSKRALESTTQMEHRRKTLLVASPVMKRVFEQADRIAKSDATMLLTGETGVGKELLARRIHSQSNRSEGPFVIVDSTTIPDALFESELFGHEKGAFTGADKQKPGRFELADRGTLFIDEIGEIPLQVQAKLLRAIQEKTFCRVGGTRDLRSNFRLVAATNRSLAQEVSKGSYRKDLYYRINVVELYLPPLRERPEDVPVLAEHFLNYFKKKYNRPWLRLSGAQEAKLKNYHWPGNVRELRNLMERAVVLSSEEETDLSLPLESGGQMGHPFTDHPTMDEMQRRYLKFVLKTTKGKISGPGGAAELLGMKRSTLESRIKRLGLR